MIPRRALFAVFMCAVGTGCVYTGWGTYPDASGDGVEPFELSSAKIITPDLTATVEVDTYQPTMVFFGLVLPVIPFLPALIRPLWSEEQLKISISFQKGDGSDSAFVQPDSLRVLLDSHEYEAVSIEASCSTPFRTPEGVRWRNDCKADQPMVPKRGGFITYDFKYLPSPRGPFSIVVEGLPRIDFKPKTRWLFGGG